MPVAWRRRQPFTDRERYALSAHMGRDGQPLPAVTFPDPMLYLAATCEGCGEPAAFIFKPPTGAAQATAWCGCRPNGGEFFCKRKE